MSKTLERHPLSALWPDMSHVEKDDLNESVRESGVIYPIVLYEGKVLDGWHRYQAAMKNDIECPSDEYLGDDPAGFVIELNAVRRNISQMERAMIIARCRKWQMLEQPEVEEKVDTSKQESGSNEPLTSNEPSKGEEDEKTDEIPERKSVQEMAEEAGVSISTMKRAKKKIEEEQSPKESIVETVEKRLTPMEQLKLEIAAKEKTILDHQNEIDDLQDRLSMITEANDPDHAIREQTFNSLKSEIRSLRSQLGEMQVRNQELKNKNYGLNQVIKRLEQQVKTLQGIDS